MLSTNQEKETNSTPKKTGFDGSSLMASVVIGFTFSAFAFLISGIYFQKKVDSLFKDRFTSFRESFNGVVSGSTTKDPVAEATTKAQEEAAKKMTEAKKTHAKTLDTDYIKGDKNAPIKIVEYSDPDCPYCTSFHATMEEVLKNYPDDVVWVYRQMPLSIHKNAQAKAEAYECIGEQGNDKFWMAIDKNFEKAEKSNPILPDQLEALAQEIGVDMEKYKTCVSDRKYKNKIDQNSTDAYDMAGKNGTPYSLFVGDLKKDEIFEIPGSLPYATMKSLIDQYKAEQK